MQVQRETCFRDCDAAPVPDSSITIRVKLSNDYPATVPSVLNVRIIHQLNEREIIQPIFGKFLESGGIVRMNDELINFSSLILISTLSAIIILQVEKDACNTQLSAEDIAALESEMSKLAESLVGEVMVLEVAQKVSAWLSWKARDRGPQFSSFYEEMEAEKEKKERLRLREKEKASRASALELQAGVSDRSRCSKNVVM